jgi:hypothetical protein
MPPGKPAGESERAAVERAWQAVRGFLEAEHHRIYEEIRQYPRPIPACDVQFNDLLEQRSLISQEQERLREALEDSLRSGDARQALEAFLASSRFLDAGAKRTIASLLEGLPQPPA